MFVLATLWASHVCRSPEALPFSSSRDFCGFDRARGFSPLQSPGVAIRCFFFGSLSFFPSRSSYPLLWMVLTPIQVRVFDAFEKELRPCFFLLTRLFFPLFPRKSSSFGVKRSLAPFICPHLCRLGTPTNVLLPPPIPPSPLFLRCCCFVLLRVYRTGVWCFFRYSMKCGFLLHSIACRRSPFLL